MAHLEELVKFSELDTSAIEDAHAMDFEDVKLYYDSAFDAMYVYFLPYEGDLIVHYVEGHDIALLYEASTLRVVGLQVEAFRKKYVPKHAELRALWEVPKEPRDLGDLIDDYQERTPGIKRKIAEDMGNRFYGDSNRDLVHA